MPLNLKQIKFAELYIATGNATQSYIKAGYTKDAAVARRNASRLLTNADVQNAIRQATDKAMDSAELTAEWVVAGLKREAQFAGEGAQHAARVKAYELLGRIARLFPDDRPPPPPNHHVNITVLSVDERQRRLDELRRRLDAVGGGGVGPGVHVGLLEVAAAAHPGVQLDVAAPPADPGEAEACDRAPD